MFSSESIACQSLTAALGLSTRCDVALAIALQGVSPSVLDVGVAGSSAYEVMCNRWMVRKLPQGHLQSLGLSFMRLRHEANKEKANSIDRDLGVCNVNCC